ncbi:MAG: hypothetical protein IAG13_25420 [Deltaproteobacteria bacterium]|nr:hypothetical protein [Nannocystaceae bacterium]
MGTESMASLVAYLRGLAPTFFAERMRAADDADIQRLEQAAGRRMSDAHREFLRAMGATPARVLNPFLNDRDFCIANLLVEYAERQREQLRLPAGVVYFSSSEITGSNIFLRQGAATSDDPEIGDLDPRTGAFVGIDAGYFEPYLRWHAFHFRLKQLDYELHVRPAWNAQESRWEGDRARCRELLEAEPFERVFDSGEYAEYFEDEGVAVALYHDGSMAMAGDDLDALRRRADGLAAQTRLIIEPVPARGRLRAPRE